MKIVGINDEKCIKCLACMVCPAKLFIKPPTKTGEKRRIPFEDPYNRCIECGHCLSICPTDAVIFTDPEGPIQFEEIKNLSSLIDYEKLMKVLRSRRSIRKYNDKMVSEEDIKAVLEAMRYAPTARNAQEINYIVINDPEKIVKLRSAVENLWQKLLKLLNKARKIKFLLPKSLKKYVTDPSHRMSIENHLKRASEGIDDVFYGAPVVIILYVPPGLSKIMAGNDAGNAVTYGMLAAQARGLGTCWIGYAIEAINRFKENKEWLNIPKKNIVTGVFIIGYPTVQYHKVPPRKAQIVDWN